MGCGVRFQRLTDASNEARRRREATKFKVWSRQAARYTSSELSELELYKIISFRDSFPVSSLQTRFVPSDPSFCAVRSNEVRLIAVAVRSHMEPSSLSSDLQRCQFPIDRSQSNRSS